MFRIFRFWGNRLFIQVKFRKRVRETSPPRRDLVDLYSLQTTGRAGALKSVSLVGKT